MKLAWYEACDIKIFSEQANLISQRLKFREANYIDQTWFHAKNINITGKKAIKPVYKDDNLKTEEKKTRVVTELTTLKLVWETWVHYYE